MQRLLQKLPWGVNLVLLDAVAEPAARQWYAERAAREGWSRTVARAQIERRLFEREGKALSNFAAPLPPADSDVAAQLFKEPYLFDFLGTTDPRREAEVERALGVSAALVNGACEPRLRSSLASVRATGWASPSTSRAPWGDFHPMAVAKSSASGEVHDHDHAGSDGSPGPPT